MLKSREPVTVRPGSLLEPVDLDAERRKLDEGHEHPVTDFDLASYLMYPKVFTLFSSFFSPLTSGISLSSTKKSFGSQ